MDYLVCEFGIFETIFQRFQQCVKVKMAWEIASTFLFHLPNVNYKWKVLSIKYFLFNKKVLHNLKKFDYLQSLLKGITFQQIDCNDLIFISVRWHRKNIELTIQEGFSSRNQPKCNQSIYNYMRLILVYDQIWEFCNYKTKFQLFWSFSQV